MLPLTKTVMLSKNLLMAGFRTPPYPFKLTCMVTSRCNLRCSICKLWKSSREQEGTLQEWKEFFGVNPGIQWLNLTGGEIFLRDDIRAIMEYSISSCPDLMLLDFPTNGTFPREVRELAEWLEQRFRGKVFITVSLDGPKKLHDAFKGREGSWDLAMETFLSIKKMKFKNVEIFFGFTIFRDNTGSFEELMRDVRSIEPSLSIKDFHFNIFQISEHYYRNSALSDLKPAPGEVINFLENLKKTSHISLKPFSFLEWYYQSNLENYLNSGIAPVTCQALSCSCFIDPFWNLYPCIIYDRKVLNLKNYGYDLINAWKQENVRDMRMAIIKGDCPRCWTPCEAYQSILASLLRRKRH